MAVPKSRALLLSGCLMMAILLQGCGGKPLSEREIVRGIFFEKQGPYYSVCLLLADKTAEGAQGNYTTAAGRDKTMAAALALAENSLRGSVYYGLTDLAALPAATTYAEARKIGSLLYEKVPPAPELSLFQLQSDKPLDWSKDAPALYDGMKACEKKWAIHCGLQQLFVQEGCCTVPVYTPDGYALTVLRQKQGNTRLAKGIPAGLAALLAGLGKELAGPFDGGTAACKATAAITATGATIRLHLRNVDLYDLAGTRKESALRKLLCRDLQTAFSSLSTWQPSPGCDPFYFAFRQQCLYGNGAPFRAPTLEIVFE